MKAVLESITIISILALSSCAAMSQKHKAADSYYEDLSTVRPAFINPDTLSAKNPNTTPKTSVNTTYTYDVAQKVALREDSLIDQNKKYSTVQGFRILVYTGTSSDEAQRVRERVYAYNSDLDVYNQYKQPSFRVKVGDYTDRVEANYMLNDLKKNFPNAMIVPDQINLIR